MFERKIFKTKNGQWSITIPPQIVKDLDLEHGQSLELESVKRGVANPQIKIKNTDEDE